MDKLLKPERFDVEPTSIAADKQWSHWKQTFSNFLSHITNTSEIGKLQLLTNYVAPNVYQYISEIETFKDAMDTLESLYIKPRNEVYARHCLATRRQQAGESIDQYLQVLKQMSKDCNFKDVTAVLNKNEYIRDAFIGGLTCSRIRQRLLENPTLTLDAAFDQARALEMAEQQSASYSALHTTTVAAVNDVTDPELETPNAVASLSNTEKCYFCGGNRHPRTSCPARNAECRSCGRKGHYQRVCKSKTSSRSVPNTTAAAGMLASASPASSNCLRKSIVDIRVNGVKLNALIDTGSSLSFINHSLVTKCRIKMLPYFGRIAMANSSLSTEIIGRCNVELEIEGYSYKPEMLIMKHLCSDAIIGHDVLQLHSSVNIAFQGPWPPLEICSLAVAQVPPISLFANLTQHCSPIATRSRRHSNENSRFINSEIQRLLNEKIIEPSNSPWRAQAFVVREENHKTRMVIDYSQTINKFTMLDAYPLPRIEEVITKVSMNKVFSTIDLTSAYHQIPILESERKYTAFEACGKLYQFLRVPFGVTNGVACFQRIIDRIVQDEGLEGTFPI